MNIARCPADQLQWAWEHARPHLEEPLHISGDKYAPEDVYRLLASDAINYHLWLIEDDGKVIGACVTTYYRYPRKLFTNVWLVGGTRFREWVHVLAENVFRMAREAGCDGVELSGRKGWLRVFKRYSVKSFVQMECAL